MKTGTGAKYCRKCGREIAIIEFGIYRKTIVDPEVVWVRADPDGGIFVRVDETKVRGVETEIGTVQAEPAYRMHRGTCGVTE